MSASTIISRVVNVTTESIILKIGYTCNASEQPQPLSYAVATVPYYNLWTDNYSEVKTFYEKHKNLPFCEITAAKSMKHKKPDSTRYWTDYDTLYHKRDGWIDTPILSPTFV